MKKKKRYVMVNKFGREIFSANSFWGFIGELFATVFVGIIMVLILMLICCGIGSLISK